ncbi:hypothetical protein ACV35P_31230, partial [Pseudomonas aeruginosa]
EMKEVQVSFVFTEGLEYSNWYFCSASKEGSINGRKSTRSAKQRTSDNHDYYKIGSVLMALKINKTEHIHASPLGRAFKVRREVWGFL